MDDLSALAELGPFHVEVGCGLHRCRHPSVRLRPPSHDTVIARFLAAPEQRMPAHAGMFLACLDAEPTPGTARCGRCARPATC